MIRLRVTPQSLESAPAFVAISGFAKEEVPLRGLAARMDGLLEGEASRLISQGRLSGAWRSQALIASRGRVAPEYVLFAGLGSLKGLTLSALSLRVEGIVARMLKTSARDISLGVFSEDAAGAGYSALASEILNGALRALARQPLDLNLTLCEPHTDRYLELVAVAERTLFRRTEGRELSLEVEV